MCAHPTQATFPPCHRVNKVSGNLDQLTTANGISKRDCQQWTALVVSMLEPTVPVLPTVIYL
jgi:hypothetical protein